MAKEEVKKNNKTKKTSNATKKVDKKEDKNNIKKKDTKRKEQLSLEEVIDEDKVEIKEVKKPIKKEENTKKIKTSDIGLIIGLIVVVIIGLFAMKGEKAKPSYTLPLELKGEAGLQLLSYADYQTKIDNNESFVVVLSRESCSHCANFMPVAKEFATDNKVPMYYVDTDTFTEDDWSGFEESNTFLTKKSGNWGTPTTIVLAGSEAVDYIEGETTKESLLELYNKYFELDK